MALHITHVHSPSDCDFCNRRTIGQSVPDLSVVCYGTSPPSRSLFPRSPRETPTSSPLRTKAQRAKLARHRRGRGACSHSLNAATSLDLLSRRQINKLEGSKKVDDNSAAETPFRRRVYTMPSRSGERVQGPSDPPMETDALSCYRLRSFSVTSRGSVINLGDQVGYRSRSDVNVTSEGSRSSLGTDDFRDRASSSASTAQSDVPHYRVLVLGDEGVGKSSLIAQFMTSEYLTVRNALVNESQDVSSGNATVSILLDGEEADLQCIESKNLILSLEDFTVADAILVMYSVTDVASFRKATHCLTMMRDLANKQPVTSLPLGPGLRSKAVILVGNKSDLARVRTVSTENGRSVASKYDVKFIETSVTIHHNVDELLVGALSQVRMKARQAAALACRHHAKFTSRAKNLWNRLLQKCDLRFHSCDNLHRL
ncbi:unnamed protein product [Larinioides sclopetarius]|uniref:Small monomeric GTPase n=1 Tax=Larinioides sclopetarius TaxID=280406 RepID=A0AAV2AZN5_9ARAC